MAFNADHHDQHHDERDEAGAPLSRDEVGPDREGGAADTAPLRALVIAEDGAVSSVALSAHGGERLAQLQRLVGGLVDVVELDGATDLWLNDEGLYLCGPNPVASRIAAAHGQGYQMFHGRGRADRGNRLRGQHPRARRGVGHGLGRNGDERHRRRSITVNHSPETRGRAHPDVIDVGGVGEHSNDYRNGHHSDGPTPDGISFPCHRRHNQRWRDTRPGWGR